MLPLSTRLSPLAAKLIASHVAALAAGAALAFFLPRKNVAHETLTALSRAPLQAGITLAFRHGDPAQARPLIERALPPAPSDAFEWSEAMNWELHLAAIDGEQIPESGRSEHLQKAGIACHRAGNGGCDLEQLREAARALLR